MLNIPYRRPELKGSPNLHAMSLSPQLRNVRPLTRVRGPSSFFKKKNRQGFKLKDVEHDQRLYGTGGVNCPLVSMRKYLNMLNKIFDSCFQRPKTSKYTDSDEWYIDAPAGQNTTATFKSKICERSQLKKRYTNHSIRATTLTTIRHAGIHPNDIMSVTGHKRAQSILNYSTISERTRRDLAQHLAAKTGDTLHRSQI